MAGCPPANLLTTTIGDEMGMANNYQGKVVGIALKDRAAILPAGHTATAAFWFDWETGSFISSTYYMKELPSWAEKFNAPSNSDKYYQNDWEPLYPVATYTRSSPDDNTYESVSRGEQRPVFPHRVKPAFELSGKEASNSHRYELIRATPFGDEITLDFCEGGDRRVWAGIGSSATDLLAISLSSPDAVGHQYGPNSIEIEDTYLRLDQDLAAFFSYLDLHFGKGNYLFFITADHGVAPSPGYSLEYRMPGGAFNESGFR